MRPMDYDEADLVRFISAMPDRGVADYVADQSRKKMLSTTVRRLNAGVLSRDDARRTAALAAIRKLGFV